MDEAAHWERVYREKTAQAVSWYRPRLEVSLALLRQSGLDAGSRVIDIGGGASTLVDDLLRLGVAAVTVLDLSTEALAVARSRLGERAARVQWMASDLIQATLPRAGFSHWHDRAVLHFLTTAEAVAAYVTQASHAVMPGGHAVIGGFAPDGPDRCSGLPVARRDAQDIAALMAPAFELVDVQREMHRTPWNSEQAFAYALLRRIAGG